MTTLDELRRANLQEQRRSAERAAAGKGAPAATPEPARPQPETAPQASAVPAASVPATPPPANTIPAAAPASAASLTPAPMEQPAPRATRNVPEPPRDSDPAIAAFTSRAAGQPGMAPEMDLPPPVRSEASLDDPFLQQVRERLSRRVIYRTGVKATVDMPPELFWRLKRYCHDHNNLTVRQAFLDLMIAYLEHEGY